MKERNESTVNKIPVLMMVPQEEYGTKILKKFEKQYEFLWELYPKKEQLEWAEVIIGQPKKSELRQAKHLKWLQITFSGTDAYMKDTSLLENIKFTNGTGAYGLGIAEYVLTMIFNLYKKMHLYRDQQNKHIWEDCGQVRSLQGKTVLIVGAGDIGTEVAKLTKVFSCYNIGIRRVMREKPDVFDEMHTLKDWELLIPKADIIVLSLPKCKESDGLVGEKVFSLMKKDAILINVGRGSAVDCDAAVLALQEEKIAGIVLDVTNPEPLPSEHPLWDCQNAIITPHITGGSFGHLKETSNKIWDLCAKNLDRYARGEELKNLVDLETGYRKI